MGIDAEKFNEFPFDIKVLALTISVISSSGTKFPYMLAPSFSVTITTYKEDIPR